MPTLDDIAAKYAGGAPSPTADPLDEIAAKTLSYYQQAQQDGPVKKVTIGKEGFADSLRSVLGNTDWGTRNIAGAGTALSNLWEGAKQFVGKGDQQRIEANKIIESEAPIGSIAGNIALTAAPFAAAGNSLKAAGAVGAGYGALQPVQGEQSLENVAKGKAINSAIGGGLGVAGQAVANKAGDWIANKAADLALQKSQRAPIDATIKEALDAGYVIPPGQVNPSFVNRQLESMAGKIATQQMASSKNQTVTDMLARRAAGLADDAPITPQTLKAARDVIKKPYEDIAQLGLQPKLDALDAARAEANAAWREYSRQGTRAALNDFKQFSNDAKAIEKSIETDLFKANKPDLMQQFRDARVALAKNHDVESALIEGGGTIDAKAIAKMFQRGDKMTGELKTIGSFANNFPKNVQAEKSMGTPDAHNLKYVMSLLAGGGGMAGLGPAGVAMGAIPMLSGPAARSIMFSKPMQQGLLSDYTLGMLPRVTGGLLQYSPVGATALGMPALAQ